jgi:hypothetical protein
MQTQTRLILTLVQLAALGAELPPSSGNGTIGRAAADDAIPDLAVVYIAMGLGAEEALFSYSVRNLRERGQYRGEVYVITDRPTCAPLGTIVVSVPPTGPLLEPRLPNQTTVPMRPVTYYKTHKMQIFDHLPARVTYALYIDMDVIPGAPIAKLLDERDRLGKSTNWRKGTPNADMLMFRERRFRGTVRSRGRVTKGEPFHGGVWLVRRGISDGCLARWLAIVLDTQRLVPLKTVRDQISLGSAVSERECHPAALSENYLRTVVVTAREDIRALEHVTRTGLVPRIDLKADDWFTFGELLLGIDAKASQQAHERPRSAPSRLALCFTEGVRACWARQEPEEGFKWWLAKNPECVRAPHAGSLHTQAIQKGWLPLTRAALEPEDHSAGASAGLAGLALALVAAAALAIRCCRRGRGAHLPSGSADGMEREGLTYASAS